MLARYFVISIIFVIQSCNFQSSGQSNKQNVSEAATASGTGGPITSSVQASPSRMSTSEFRRKIILDELTDYYRIYLYREPDQAGLDFWSQHVFDKNITMARAKELIKSSDEARSVEKPPEYQFIPPAGSAVSNCSYVKDGVQRNLSSQEGYITQFAVVSATSYPGKAYYKENSSWYCEKRRVRCWAGQFRRRVVKIKHVLSKNSGCFESVFNNRPENDRTYIKDLSDDVEEIYNYCERREPTRREYDQTITSVVEQKGTIYDTAAFLCGW